MPADVEAIRAHLLSIDPQTGEDVVALAVVLQETADDDMIMAVSRARDLIRQPELAQGLHAFLSGWLALQKVDFSTLTGYRRDTLVCALRFILEDFSKKSA